MWEDLHKKPLSVYDKIDYGDKGQQLHARPLIRKLVDQKLKVPVEPTSLMGSQ
jgi:hypothetical protein